LSYNGVGIAHVNDAVSLLQVAAMDSVRSNIAWFRAFRPIILLGLLLTGCERLVPSVAEPEESVANAFPSDALKEYLPANAAAVYSLKPQSLLDSSKGLGDTLKPLIRKVETGERWLSLAGIDLSRDVDEFRVCVTPHDLDQPLLLLHGRFDPARFHVGAGELKPVVAGNGERFRLYEYEDRRLGEAMTLAVAGDWLVACEARKPVLAALSYAMTPSKTTLRDGRLREMLARVDRQQPLWLAVSFDHLKPLPRLKNKGLELILRPILQLTDGMEGGFNLADDVRADLQFQAHDEQTARQLEELLQSSCEVARGAHLLPGVDPSLAPLFKLVGTGETSRDGATVRLRCRLAAEELRGK
jgi:hypothetical protein